MKFWGSDEAEEENEFSRLWEDIERQERRLEEEEIDLDTVEEFVELADLGPGEFFKERHSHRFFTRRVDEEGLRRYRDSGLLSEMDLGDHTEFYFVTERGGQALFMDEETLNQNIDLYRELVPEDGEQFWELGATDRDMEGGPRAVRGDPDEDYIVKEGEGGLLGGWQKRLTGKGRKVKDKARAYEPDVIDSLIEAEPHPDPERFDVLETIILEGSSSIRERVKLVETFMGELRRSYEEKLEEESKEKVDSWADVAYEMSEEWDEVLDYFQERQEELEVEGQEIRDAGTEYMEAVRQRLEEFRENLKYFERVERLHESDIERIKDQFYDLEKTYWQEVRN